VKVHLSVHLLPELAGLPRAERVLIWQDAYERAPGLPILAAWCVWILLLSMSMSIAIYLPRGVGILVGGMLAGVFLIPTWLFILGTVRPYITDVMQERQNSARQIEK
jgi:hypothetical protein